MPFIPVGLLLLTSISCAEGQDNHPRPRDRAGQNLDAALGRQAARVRSERQLSASRAQSCNSRGACEAMGCDFHTGMGDCRPCCGSRPTDTQATSRPTPPPPTNLNAGCGPCGLRVCGEGGMIIGGMIGGCGCFQIPGCPFSTSAPTDPTTSPPTRRPTRPPMSPTAAPSSVPSCCEMTARAGRYQTWAPAWCRARAATRYNPSQEASVCTATRNLFDYPQDGYAYGVRCGCKCQAYSVRIAASADSKAAPVQCDVDAADGLSGVLYMPLRAICSGCLLTGCLLGPLF